MMTSTGPRKRIRGRSQSHQYQSTNSQSAVDVGDASNGDQVDDDDISVEPMDEDDQKMLVASLHAEAAAQSRFFQKLFGYGIGGFATLFSLCFPLLCADECGHEQTCWVHAVYAGLVHIWTVSPFIFQLTTAPWWKAVFSLTFQVTPWLVWLSSSAFSHDEDHFHLGLMIGNLVTYFGAFLVQWDMQTTSRALDELNDAQYKHKGL